MIVKNDPKGSAFPYKIDEVTLRFGEDFPDGRLTAEPTPNSSRPFKLNEVLLEIQRLGRPLTHEEFEKFYV